MSAWSRDLLESTRLLMDSPAGRDPKRRVLLQDLELVLVQLVETGPTMRTEDQSVMDELLTRSALLLTRIRTTVPAGGPASHNQDRGEKQMMWTISLALATQVATQPLSGASSDAVQWSVSAQWQPRPDPADSLLRVASARMARGDYRDAANLYKLAARLYPTRCAGAKRCTTRHLRYTARVTCRARVSALDALRRGFPQQAAHAATPTHFEPASAVSWPAQGDSDCAEEVARGRPARRLDRSRRVRRRAHRAHGRECPDGDDDEDDTRIAALNALLQMDADACHADSQDVLARRDPCSERLAPEGGVSGRAEAIAQSRPTFCSLPRGTIPTLRCASSRLLAVAGARSTRVDMLVENRER